MSKKKKQKKEPKQKNNAVELVPQHSIPGSRQSASAPRMSYGSHGASQTLTSMVGWIIDAGIAEDNIDLYPHFASVPGIYMLAVDWQEADPKP